MLHEDALAAVLAGRTGHHHQGQQVVLLRMGQPRAGRGRPLRQPAVALGGVRLPRDGEVRWELPEGPFTYWRGRVTSLEPVA